MEYSSKNRKLLARLAEQGSGGGDSMKRTRSEPSLADSDTSLPRIVIGICAMEKKARSKPMAAIIERLITFGEFEVEVFGDDVTLNSPITEWPLCDVLLSWHSDGFPLEKAQRYAALRKPYLINDMAMQDVLLDRRRVYQKLQESGIPVPHHIAVNRDDLGPGQDPPGFVETEDYVELDGVQIKKPFVEKPASGEDHNIYIYYPHAMGGGVKKLYRKVHNKSGDYDPNHPGTVRRDGSYIIEEFLTTGGTDVKVYTVGPRYAHAEARKSPVVDGKVTRSADGKELRFPVLLSPQEKEIARMVCLAFGQKVCGFDLLRSERGKSYVCDVNGWSFVKNSVKYYDDAAGILRSIVLSAIAPHRLATSPPQALAQPGLLHPECQDMFAAASPLGGMPPRGAAYLDGSEELDERGHYEELRCVLAVVRHGDRTPKQKMKMKVTQEPILELLRKHVDSKGKQAKLKSPAELQELLDVTRGLLEEWDGAAGSSAASELKLDADQDETREKFRIVKTVLEQGGSFAGVNRKVQLKPLRWAALEEGSAEQPRVVEALLILKHGGVLTHAGRQQVWRVVEALLFLKYGGVLTHAGRQQAEALGNVFRTVMYPRYGPAGGGLLRLHSTYRHDLKIYSSDEGRVQTSAAAFTQGLLDLEGDSLTPILVSLVKKDAGMLDAFGKGASDDIQAAKAELYAQMTWDPAAGQSLAAPSQMTTPLPSPPPSPMPVLGSLSDSEPMGGSPPSPQPGAALAAGAAAPSFAVQGSVPPSLQDPNPNPRPLPPGLAGRWSGDACAAGAAGGGPYFNRNSGQAGGERRSGDGQRPRIHPLPPKPLALLRELVQHLKVLVEQLRGKCLQERVDKSGEAPRGYSALTQSPREWALEVGKPCGGERLLLMFDRWRKLLKAFYSERKQQFDISKVPDIYDSAKYDAIHNSELGLTLKPLYATAKVLADAVIPNEYGIDPGSKLRIGSKICCALLGKLLADLANMREESLATAGMVGGSEPVSPLDSRLSAGAAREMAGSAPARLGGSQELAEALDAVSLSSGVRGGEDAVTTVPEEDDEVDEDREALHRLCPTYATDINSPLRHVRTRIYFTSESHMHSLINVLRYSHCGREGGGDGGLVSEEAMRRLRDTTELDYLTHVVFRMYENKRVPVEDPARFRVEVLFSPGASHNLFEVVPLKQDHTLPVAPRMALHRGAGDVGSGTTWARLAALLTPHATPAKASTYTYSMV
ncbi:hypothetical protein WJX81_008214 [Elliptochloris bilobata]|uniref:Inositol hexakisphosphate and diphosphoinositol-pentakisphosphate kinase n=1 Tax=Elliptochloris bilobata TaxID=381761 RepID=A0AAW1QKL5_9CHLO